MSFFLAFVLCFIGALINLPSVLKEGGAMINLISMIFCAGLAVLLACLCIKDMN